MQNRRDDKDTNEILAKAYAFMDKAKPGSKEEELLLRSFGATRVKQMRIIREEYRKTQQRRK